MERLYGAFIDPRDPEHEATLGRAPSGYTGTRDAVAERIAVLLAADALSAIPEAALGRRDTSAATAFPSGEHIATARQGTGFC